MTKKDLIYGLICIFISLLRVDCFGQRRVVGLFPTVLNLATNATITANATCGETGPETYCRLVEHVQMREPHCDTCDAISPNPDQRHSITNAIDGSTKWWQSPSLQNGAKYQWVTITLDLKQIFQISYVILKTGPSPRPGNWVLERSVDGVNYRPWQYYAVSDGECWEAFTQRPTAGTPKFRFDDEVICTSFYSKIDPLENAEIHTSLINGRPGIKGPSQTLTDFSRARYIRLRLQKIRTLNADLMSITGVADRSVTRRYFYTISDISIGGQCVCSGHAKDCVYRHNSTRWECQCEHNTCGESCNRCCKLFNQKPWRAGTNDDGAVCEQCQCYGHADECAYDQKVADEKTSLNIEGKYEGGGVCIGCRSHTAGINCEQCENGYYRPLGVRRDHRDPCKPCRCSGPGISGQCIKDDSHLAEHLHPGDCLCKQGFTGKRCEHCAPGYRNYPLCEACPCNHAGSVDPKVCEGNCRCKKNVEGPNCNLCKEGFYNLDAKNPDGCSPCYCFGITDKCESSDWGIELVKSLPDWKVTDIKGTKVVRPVFVNGVATIAHDDISGIDNYYWRAPPNYLGKKLYSYGGDLRFLISYVVARGDTSGIYTDASDVILEGENVMIGYSWGKQTDEDNTTITVPLREQNWFILNKDSTPGEPVTRDLFAKILNNVKRLLIRAKFHTDQIEATLYNVEMETAAKESNTIRKMTGVEYCKCPLGYTGLSCELCSPGYRKINGVCERCDCNNHAESCHERTGECQNCLHNTMGIKCERCQPGYYGNPTLGTPYDCKKCACPLEIPSNNFSPTCNAVTTSDGRKDYVCNDCAIGYTGDKCERCANGYFGNPMTPGGYCQPCECGEGIERQLPGYCDSVTGRCLRCTGNTGGWNCNECLPGHFGNPLVRDCRPCTCSKYGSESNDCDKTVGQCICKPNFVGISCDKCADGYGNIELGCIPCRCNTVGSESPNCDPVTGQCRCKPGVFGTRCDQCLEAYYGFSNEGCKYCKCDPNGALSPQCDENKGQCRCKPHISGRTCDQCQDGYWNLVSEKGCEPCNCNYTGSISPLCNQLYGQCNCKPGVGNKHCDACLPGHYGFSVAGCKKCDPCDIPGRTCDPKNGRCVCPPYTTGQNCQRCALVAWGYDPSRGCKPCECNPQGSERQECDPSNGHCTCSEGFEGRKCDKCRYGFYRFPNCRRCKCTLEGTQPGHCSPGGRGPCQCDESGQCPCKVNVDGKKCERCRQGTFGLSANNPKGCFTCFCFGKAQSCDQAKVYWTQVTLPSRTVRMSTGDTELTSLHGLKVIPGAKGDVNVGIPYVIDQPLYWSLPEEFLGDKVSAYNGNISFRIDIHSNSRFPDALLEPYPLILLQGNHRLVLTHHHFKQVHGGQYSVRLHESEWQQHNNPHLPVTRELLMVALQNLQYILIRSTEGPDVKYARISNVSLQIAAPPSSGQITSLAQGCEVCRCPPQYVGLSCQDPAPGYYRKRKPNYLDSKDILDLVGWAELCPCNNRSRTCDRETGICFNCTGNTGGPYCNVCNKGYYGDPAQGCRRCACPTATSSFSDSCRPEGLDYVCTNCQAGYAGRHCETCADGYYGDPLGRGGSTCQPCNCNTYGSKSPYCDKLTGQCDCLEGITGKDCTRCLPRYFLTAYGCKSCNDNCTGVLLDEVDFLMDMVERTNLSGISPAPWGYLFSINNETIILKRRMEEHDIIIREGQRLLGNATFNLDTQQVQLLLLKANELAKRAPQSTIEAIGTHEEARALLKFLDELWDHIQEIVDGLRHRGSISGHSGSGVDADLADAEKILKELRERDFTKPSEEAQRELRKAEALLERVKSMTSDPLRVDGLRERLKQVEDYMTEFVNKIQSGVQEPTLSALKQIANARKSTNEIKYAISKSNEHLGWSNDTLNEAEDHLEKARKALLDAAVKFENVPRSMKELDNLTQQMEEKRGILARLNPEYLKKYVIPAQEHAEKLQRQADNLAKLFNVTRKVSDLPLQAANAYQSIVDALAAAEAAAKRALEAAETAYDRAYPGTDDALTAQAKKAKELSKKLLDEANNLNFVKVPELKSALNRKKKVLDGIANDLQDSYRNLDLINKALMKLPTGGLDSLKDLAKKHRRTMNDLGDTHALIDDINDRIAKELLPKVRLLSAGSAEGLDNITKIIEKARSDIRASTTKADNADKLAKKVTKLHGDMQLDLKALRDKILLAKQKASSIKISLSANEQNQCVRSFRPEVEPTTFNNILLNYAIKSEARDSLLFFLGSNKKVPEGREPDDFMAIEMYNRSIRFIWNAGGGTQTIQHKAVIETNDPHLVKNSQWYKIEVTRVGNSATLTVKRTPDGQLPDPDEVQGSSTAGFSKMDIDKDSYFYIGGLPTGYKPPRDLKTNSFAGCLHEVYLDGKRVGLWNFKSNKGCDACKEGATEDVDTTMCTFKGDGYVIMPQIFGYNEMENTVTMRFKTFDEDALLFFNPNPETGDYISLELRGGKVVYRFREGNRPPLTLTTQKKYNLGDWVQIGAQRQLKMALLTVNQEEREAKASEITGKLKLRKSQLYFGGIPPNFTTTNWPHLNFHSFLGCLQSIQIDTTNINLGSQGSSYNIEPGCVDKVVKVVAFKGSGYVELDGEPLGSNESSFSFTFQTVESDALLLLSTFEGQDEQTARNDNMPPKKKGKTLTWDELLQQYYSLSLVGGKLEGTFSSGDKPSVISTDQEVNDGRYHTVTVVRQNRKISLSVNDKHLKGTRLPKGSGTTILAPSKGGLFFGGVPDRINIGNMAASRKFFKGTIKDAVFNGKLLRFNQPVSFESVGIGRTIKSQIDHQMSDSNEPVLKTAQVERCADMEKFTVEKQAVKFGDAIRSHATLSLNNKKLFARDFSVTFEFRTYFPNGIILFLKNGRKKFYFVVYLENGRVRVATFDDTHHEVVSQNGLNDGLWHNVTLVKKGHKVEVNVNGGGTTQSLKVRKRLGVTPPLYVGGVPDSIKLAREVMVRESFKGCVRQFEINGKYIDIASGQLENVIQCFTKIERGAYFNGDSHAIFSSNFDLGGRLDLALEFKTTKLNGILISLSDPSGAPSLAIELKNGKVIANVNTGTNLGVFNATKGFHSKYEMCDGKWHVVKMLYVKDSITLKVDSYEVAYGLSSHKFRDGTATPRTSSPIYIGGIPDYAENGSLSIRNNFVGCLNNLVVDEKRVDWRDMASLHNVLPNSCPLF